MANCITHDVRRCHSCTNVYGTKFNKKHHPRLNEPSDSLEFVAISILDPLPNTTGSHAYVLVVTNRYSKLARSILLRSITKPIFADVLIMLRMFVYEIPRLLLTEKDTLFMSKIFENVFAMLCIKQLSITVYKPQTNR